MRYQDILREGKIGISRATSRVWFNAKTGDVVFVPLDDNHSNYVATHPDFFGLTREDLGLDRTRDYDGRVLKMAMDNGWVRVRVDPRDSSNNTNVEATKMRWAAKCVRFLVEDMGPDFRRLIVVERQGEGDKEGTAVVLSGMEQIEFFIKFARQPPTKLF